MSNFAPFIAKEKSYVSKKIAQADASHPVMVGGVISAAETFPILAGEVLGKMTSGPNAGKLGRYDDARTDGAEVAVGISNEQIDAKVVGSTGIDIVTAYIAHGVVYETACVGLNAAAKVDLKGQIIFI